MYASFVCWYVSHMIPCAPYHTHMWVARWNVIQKRIVAASVALREFGQNEHTDYVYRKQWLHVCACLVLYSVIEPFSICAKHECMSPGSVRAHIWPVSYYGQFSIFREERMRPEEKVKAVKQLQQQQWVLKHENGKKCQENYRYP